MHGRARLEESIYRIHQSVWSAWARRRFAADFDRVARFCLFVGYPRSGHSLVGALLNAHRDAVIAHELNAAQRIVDGCTRGALYSRILARAYWFNLRGNVAETGHAYQVPNQWQGRFAILRVIGDKRGGAVTRCIAAHSDFLDRVRALVAVPLRLVHVVRNPFDNISAISIRQRWTLADSAELYFRHCQTTDRLDALCHPAEVTTIHHEQMIRDPRSALSDLCGFLGLDAYPGYLDDCSSVVFSAPSHTRRQVDWPAALVRDVERRARPYRFLDGYGFDIPTERPPPAQRAL